jgi:hypothetical protein
MPPAMMAAVPPTVVMSPSPAVVMTVAVDKHGVGADAKIVGFGDRHRARRHHPRNDQADQARHK